MDWPRTPVERQQRFRPPFCPWPSCSQHLRSTPGYRFRRHGFFRSSRRLVPRFLCSSCRRSFSRQSFSTSYYLKRPELLLPVAAALLAGSAHRQIARSFGCAPSTVSRLTARLGRHALLLLTRALARLHGRLSEPLVIDHFETFEFSQDLPFAVATPVGSSSWFVYGLDPIPHARAGRRSPAQHLRLLQRPHRPSRGGFEGSFQRLLDGLLRLSAPDQLLDIVCDGKPEYRSALERHPRNTSVRLHCYPNPLRGPKGSRRSPEAIERDRAMFPVDTFHALLRHSAAQHKRHTIAFGRRLAAVMERLFLAAVWRNFVKGRSERRPRRGTPAMQLGLSSRRWSWRHVLAQRLFLQREKPPEVWRELYHRKWTTPVLPRNTIHQLKHAL